MKMREHVTVVGALHIGLGALGILAAIIVLASTIGPGLLVLSLEGDAEPLTILTIIGGIVAVFIEESHEVAQGYAIGQALLARCYLVAVEKGSLI